MSPVPDLIVHIRTTPAPTLIAGELDALAAPQLRRRVQALPATDVALVSAGAVLDAARLSGLLETQARPERADARMVLAAAPRIVRRVITIAALVSGAHLVINSR